MCYEGFLVGLSCLLISLVARSNETLVVRRGVRVPPPRNWGEECVSKSFSVFFYREHFMGVLQRGRAIRGMSMQLCQEFDSTRGFPGEDIGRHICW